MSHVVNGICSPEWFFWKDIFIDIIILIVIFFMVHGIMEYKKISNKKDCYGSMIIAFLLVSVSFILKIIVNSVLYKTSIFPGWDFWTMSFYSGMLIVSYILSRLFFAIGILYLYSMYYKPTKHSIFLISFLIALALYFTRSNYYVWHLIISLFLLLIVIKALDRLKERSSPLRLLLTGSFILFLLSQLFFIFIGLNLIFYVIGEFLQLFGYITMASILVVVKQYGKKKESVRHCC